MEFTFFSFPYFFYLILSIVIFIYLYIKLKNKSDKAKEKILYGILFASFVVHFAKIFIFPYTTIPFPQRIRKLSLENISATLVVFMPFVFKSKNKTLKDFMVIAGIASGLAATLYPLDAISQTFDGKPFPLKDPFSIEIVRFYFAHFVMWAIPLLFVLLGLHELNIKRAIYLPFIFMGVLSIVYANEILLVLFKLIDRSELHSISGRNPSFIFGVRESEVGLKKALTLFAPSFMVTPVYWPVIWLLGPIFIYGNIIIYSFYFILEVIAKKHDNILEDVEKRVEH